MTVIATRLASRMWLFDPKLIAKCITINTYKKHFSKVKSHSLILNNNVLCGVTNKCYFICYEIKNCFLL